jgi:hypothetical protein
MGEEATGDNADRVIARFQQRYGEKKDLLVYERGKYIEAKDCADAWRQLNSFMFQGRLLDEYRLGNRHIVPNITLVIEKWGNLIPLSAFGYNPGLRMSRLIRNYQNMESLNGCRDYMESRRPSKHSTHGIVFGTGKKKTPPCMVGGTLYYAPGRLYVNFFLRASEVTKTLGADFHFLQHIIQQSAPGWMNEVLAPVKIHLSMAYALAQWFPLLDMIMPGYPLNTYDNKFHRMCMSSLRKARDVNGYESKWKPEKRLHRFYRKEMPKFKTDIEGRIISGPSFFPRKKRNM